MAVDPQRTARHEARHVCFALDHGLPVEQVSVSPGYTTYRPVLQPLACVLAVGYRLRPMQTQQQMLDRMGVILAGHGGCNGSFSGSDDALELRQWRAAWQDARTGVSWGDLLTAADTCVTRWSVRPRTQYRVQQVADALLVHGTLTGADVARVLAPRIPVSPPPPVAPPPRRPRPTAAAACPQPTPPPGRLVPHGMRRPYPWYQYTVWGIE